MSSILTRGEFITKVIDHTGRPATGTTVSGVAYTSLLATAYEWALLRIARAFSFPEMDVFTNAGAATVTSQKAYTFSALFGLGSSVRDILMLILQDGLNSRRLKRVTEREFYRLVPYPEAATTGKPTSYCRVGNSVHLFPIPDAAYTLNTCYSKFPTAALSDASTAEFDFKDDVIFAGMMVEFLRHLQEHEEAKRWDGIFRDGVKNAVKPVIHPTDWEPEGRASGSEIIVPGDYWNNPFVM
jgi:hypothetical protein